MPSKPETAADREQVAAICYRVHKLKIEFLLVRTRKGRWTFPKGGVVRGLTSAQSAALEAFEEGGVHGRIEEAAFTHYVVRKGKSSRVNIAITTHAHLCEVHRVGAPEEPGRSPTWFSAEKARALLKERRTPEDASELARVVDRAVSRIRRLGEREGGVSEPMQRVHFEFFEKRAGHLIARFALLPYGGLAQPGTGSHAVIDFDTRSQKRLRLQPGNPTRRSPR